MENSRALSFRDLIVWQKAKRIAVMIFRITKGIAREHRYEFVSQVHRAALSVSSNIAEGWGRGTRKELHQFLTISRGSLYELESLLDVGEEAAILEPEALVDIRSVSSEVERMLSAMRSNLRRKS